MNKEEQQQYIGSSGMTLVEAMKMIDHNAMGIIYIVDSGEQLVGCLTDGDVRRWIIQKGNVETNVQEVMNRNPQYVHEEERNRAIVQMKAKNIYSIAIVDEKKKIVDIAFWKSGLIRKRNADSNVLKGIPVIIMAGGKGTRLFPYTKILPKPLIPIGDIPIVERIMDQFCGYGAEKFYITVNYKKEMIKAYFSTIHSDYQIVYVDEEKPLGTAGSISLIKEKLSGIVLVTNCDILIRTNYEELIKYHYSLKNDITVVTSLKNLTIPYGVLHMGKDGLIASMEEKPQVSYLINTGMYIVDAKYLKWIPYNKVFHMTELTEMLIRKGLRVGAYPVGEDSFFDMGQLEEMKKMEEQFNSDHYGTDMKI